MGENLVFTVNGKNDFQVPRDYEWFAFPGHHGLIWIQTQPASQKNLILVVQWFPAGYWRAALVNKPWRKNRQRVQIEHFHSEDEAKRFLETRAALYPKGDL